jgi:hypothetical protein
MDKTQEHSGTRYDVLNKENLVPKKTPPPVVAPPAGQKLLTEAEKKAFKKIKTASVYTPPAVGAGINAGAEAGGEAGGEDAPEATQKKAGPAGALSSLMEGNNKYIVIAVALLAVYFLFIKKR